MAAQGQGHFDAYITTQLFVHSPDGVVKMTSTSLAAILASSIVLFVVFVLVIVLLVVLLRRRRHGAGRDKMAPPVWTISSKIPPHRFAQPRLDRANIRL